MESRTRWKMEQFTNPEKPKVQFTRFTKPQNNTRFAHPLLLLIYEKCCSLTSDESSPSRSCYFCFWIWCSLLGCYTHWLWGIFVLSLRANLHLAKEQVTSLLRRDGKVYNRGHRWPSLWLHWNATKFCNKLISSSHHWNKEHELFFFQVYHWVLFSKKVRNILQ